MMYYADHHGFPIVTFIDTPGAFADLKSEELGQVCKDSLFFYERKRYYFVSVVEFLIMWLIYLYAG